MPYFKHIGLQNFRVFKDLTDFEFKPITILTGTNSSGKSSLIKALMLLKETFNLKENTLALDHLFFNNDTDNFHLGTFQTTICDNGNSDIISFEFDTFIPYLMNLKSLGDESISKYLTGKLKLEYEQAVGKNEKKKSNGYLKQITLLADGEKTPLFQATFSGNWDFKFHFDYFSQQFDIISTIQQLEIIFRRDFGHYSGLLNNSMDTIIRENSKFEKIKEKARTTNNSKLLAEIEKARQSFNSKLSAFFKIPQKTKQEVFDEINFLLQPSSITISDENKDELVDNNFIARYIYNWYLDPLNFFLDINAYNNNVDWVQQEYHYDSEEFSKAYPKAINPARVLPAFDGDFYDAYKKFTPFFTKISTRLKSSNDRENLADMMKREEKQKNIDEQLEAEGRDSTNQYAVLAKEEDKSETELRLTLIDSEKRFIKSVNNGQQLKKLFNVEIFKLQNNQESIFQYPAKEEFLPKKRLLDYLNPENKLLTTAFNESLKVYLKNLDWDDELMAIRNKNYIVESVDLPEFDFILKIIQTIVLGIESDFASLDYISTNRPDNPIEKLIRTFSNTDFSDEEVSFFKSTLQRFNLAEDVLIETNEDGFHQFYLIYQGKRRKLAYFGYGVSQILPIILKVMLMINRNYPHKNTIKFKRPPFPNNLILEEPETNLHPALQSKLADFLVEAHQKFHINFIIETHSEYLIRKLQFLTAKEKIKPEDSVIYYFYPPNKIPEGEPQVKRIDIEKDGRLTDEFGTGFFDEADNIAIELFQLSKSQKN